ncbi:MAG: polyprenyl diphosphate synthase [Gammaproteobacteria bacterium]
MPAQTIQARGSELTNLPRHVAIIMDGNGRWAKQRSLPRHAGHRAGVRSASRIVKEVGHRGIRCLTLFAFSSENWRRPSQEVGLLMSLFVEALEGEIDELHENKVRLRFIGDTGNLSPKLSLQIEKTQARTQANDGLQLVIAVAYGGRWDLVRAARTLAKRAVAGEITAENIDSAAFAEHLALAGLPDPDLLIRTGGEQRISNFLLWHLAYSELFFTDTLWPDFGTRDLDTALLYFAARERRYGRIAAQIEV